MVASLLRQTWILTAMLGIAAVIASCAARSQAQQQCVAADRVVAITDALKTARRPQPDDALRQEIVDLRTAVAAAKLQRMTAAEYNGAVPTSPDRKFEETARKAPERVCAILNSTGWPTKSLVGPD